MSTLDLLGYAGALAAGVAGLGYLTRLLRKAARKLDAIDHLVSRELEHNHGSSMKDDVHGVALAVGKLQRDQDETRRRLNRALRMAAKHHPEDAWLYELDDRSPT